MIFYELLIKIYRELSENRTAHRTLNLSRQNCEEISTKYKHQRDNIYQVYVYLVLLDERIKGNIPAWEGIRIVREIASRN